MMTIKTTTWSDGVELTRLFESNGSEIIINRWHYNTYEQYYNLVYEKFNTGEHPSISIGDPPQRNDLAYAREFLWVSYYNPNGDLFTFVLNHGYLYVMQDGKTVEKYYVDYPNKTIEKEETPQNDVIKESVQRQ